MTEGQGASVARQIQLARQPIFDPDGEVEGWQLLARGDSLMDVFASLDETHAAQKLLCDAFLEMDVWSLTGGLPAYVRFPTPLLVGLVPGALPPELTVLQLSDDAAPTPELIDALGALRRSGYRLAVGGLTATDQRDALRRHADVVKVDVAQVGSAVAAQVVDRARRDGVKVIAECVDNRQQEATARLLRFDAYQGQFFRQPLLVTGHRLGPARTNQLQLVAVAGATDVDFDAVADLIRRDPALALKFLNYVNASFFGWSREVESIRHGVTLLGEDGVRRWSSLLLVNDAAGRIPGPVLVDAISRGRFCEGIAERLAGQGKGAPSPLHGFLTGVFSLLDTMLGSPMDEILPHLAVPDQVCAALLEGDGPLGLLLGLVVAYERGAWSTVEGRAAALGMPTSELTVLYLDALGWARATLDASDLATS